MDTPFDPVAWDAPKAPPLIDAYEKNQVLAKAELWVSGANGPEDVIVDSDGSVVVGTADGMLLQLDGNKATALASVGGRPLGLEWYGDDILVCNADLGLQLVSKSGTVTSMVSSVDDEPLVLTNNASVSDDGTIYFTESTNRWTLDVYVNDLLEGQTTGRLLERSPSGDLRTLVGGLQFANGVALDASQESVFFAETGRYRVSRYWLKGDKAGQTDVFLDNLPGFPDNLSFDDGILWVALASPRQAIVDLMNPKPWMRKLAFRMPDALKPKPLRHGIILGYDNEGTLIHNLQDSTGTVAITTSARFSDGRLFIGSLADPHVAVHTLS